MAQSGSGSIWDAIRSWADSAGLLLPTEEGTGRKPRVPQSVCDNCPICQAAATLDEVNPAVVEDMLHMARNLMAGLGSALASASDQRGAGVFPGHTEPTGPQAGADRGGGGTADRGPADEAPGGAPGEAPAGSPGDDDSAGGADQGEAPDQPGN
jgi:hypothetical protein